MTSQEDDVEPPVPAGLRTLSQPLECFANFLGIDFDLIAAAAEQSQEESQLEISSSEILTWVRNVPETEKDSLLARIIEDDTSHPEAALRQRFFSEIRAKYPATVRSGAASNDRTDPCSCGRNHEGSTKNKA